jgi:transposase
VRKDTYARFLYSHNTMKSISKEISNNIISLLDKGLSLRQIATELGVSHSTVMRERLKARPNIRKDQGGRPPKLTVADKRRMVRTITSGNVKSAAQLARELKNSTMIDVSADTVCRTLKEAGLRAITKKKKPRLSPRHIRQRLDFAKRHQYWTLEDWKRVIWSDETKINRLGSDGQKWAWKKRGDNILADHHVQGTVKFGGGHLMMWACMTAQGIGYACRIDHCMNAEVYTGILDNYLLPTIEYYGLQADKIIFQQDNDSKHTSQAARKWFENNGIEVLEWPPQSPDLSPIENLFEYLKQRLSSYETEPNGMLELWERVEKELDKITSELCMKFIESMPNRIAAVLKARGGYTKY